MGRKEVAAAARSAAQFFEEHPTERAQGVYFESDTKCFCAIGKTLDMMHVAWDGQMADEIIDIIMTAGLFSAVTHANDSEPVTDEPPVRTIAALRNLADKLEGK